MYLCSIVFLLFFFMKKIFVYTILFLPLCLVGQSLTDSLKAYYPFNGNAQDASGLGHNGVPQNGTALASDRFGNANSAYYFDGIDDHIQYTTSSHLRPNVFPVTMSLWFNSNIIPSGTDFYELYNTEQNNGTGDYSGYWMNISPYTGVFSISYGDNTGACSGPYRRSYTGNVNVCDGQWHLLTGIVNGPMNMELYIDCQPITGTYTGSGATSVGYSGSPIGQIGHKSCGTNPSNYHTKGYIDDVRFYDRALSQADIIALYNFPYPPTGVSSLNLGNDTIICASQVNMLLNATTFGASSYQWSNGQTGPTITVTQPGQYSVVVNMANCGQYKDTIMISTGVLQQNIVPDAIICEGQSVILDAGSGYTSYSWSTGATTQTITVSTPGTYSVQVSNGNCIISDSAIVTHNSSPSPTALFTYTITSQTGGMYNLSFINNSSNALNYLWDFGDGTTSNLSQPIHAFNCINAYTIQLIAYNACESDTITQIFYRGCGDAISDISQAISLQIFPIPANEDIYLHYELAQATDVELQIVNSLGQVILKENYADEIGEIHKELNVATLAEGVYYLRLSTNRGIAVHKLAIE